MEKIKCVDLWKDWMFSDPDNYHVIAAKERISKYSRDDWNTMSTEATYLTKMLGELVLYNIPVESKIAESAFRDFVDHFHKWFFPIDKKFIFKLSILCKNDDQYSEFFDEFHPGLGSYISKLSLSHLSKSKD